MAKKKVAKKKAKKKVARKKAPSSKPAKGKVIKAKPTRYRGVLYPSRNEANWALFFDAHTLINSYAHEPEKFVHPEHGWNYTPDFVVHSAILSCYFEIKPTVPTQEYIDELISFVPVVANRQTGQGPPLLLGWGSWFKKVPLVYELPWEGTVTPEEIESNSQPLGTYLAAAMPAIQFVHDFRWDLNRERPTMRTGRGESGTKGPQDYLREHIANERANQRKSGRKRRRRRKRS